MPSVYAAVVSEVRHSTGGSQDPPKNGWETSCRRRSLMQFQRAPARTEGADPRGKKKMKPPPHAVPPLHLPGRSWWLLPASAFLFAIALTFGLLAKLYGSPGPDLAWDEGLIPGRTTAQTGVSLALDSCSPRWGTSSFCCWAAWSWRSDSADR
jgi:hypothetical protein